MSPPEHAAVLGQLGRVHAAMIELLHLLGAPADAAPEIDTIFGLLARLAEQRRTVH